jgi:outer membrane protein TolC
MKLNGILFLLLIWLAGNSQSDVQLSYNNFIATMLQNNPKAKIADNIKRYGQAQFTASRGNYDPILIGSYDQKQFKNSNYFTLFNAEVKQQIFTSQYFKFGYDYGIGNNINPEIQTPDYGLPYMGVEVGLLQGLLIDKRRAEVLKSKAYANYYDAEREIQLNNLLFDASQGYFDWLFTLKQLWLNNYFMQVAKQRLIGIEALANIGERATVDTIEAAIFYQTRLLDYQNAVIENQKSINYLAFYNQQSTSNTPMPTTILATDSLDYYYNSAKNIIAERLSIEPLLNPVLTKYKSFQNVLDIDKRLKKEMIKPRLNVNYNFLSGSTTNVNPLFSTNNYKWGANVSFPLFFRNSVNEYKMAKFMSQNNTFDLVYKENELTYKLNIIKQTISTLLEQLLNAEKSVKYSKLLVEAEKLKFLNGESTLFILNARESKLLEFELKLLEYKLKIIKTVLNIMYLKGDLNYKL